MHSRAKEKCLLDYPQFRPFSTAPPLLGKILEKKEAREAGVRQGKGNQTGWQGLLGGRTGPHRGKFQVTWAAKAGTPAQSSWFWKAHFPPTPTFWKGSVTG